jgi:glucokinase
MTETSHVVHGNERRAAGFDIGGTKIAAAVVTESGKVLERIIVAAPERNASPHAVEDTVSDLLAKLRGIHPEIQAVGAGVAGLVEWPQGVIKWAPNSPHEGLHLKALLERDSGLPVVVDNDANTAAWAEAMLGPAELRGKDLVFLTVGTGVGGGIILDGKLYRGQTGMGVEMGHMILDTAGPICGCGHRGCLEALSSGTALERRAQQAVLDFPDSALSRVAASRNLTGRDVWQAAVDGDGAARDIFSQLGYWLGVGIANITSIFEVEFVVIGGGLAEVGDLILDPIRASVAEHVFAPRYRGTPSVVTGTFGNDAGFIGAAHMALQRVDATNDSTARV